MTIFIEVCQLVGFLILSIYTIIACSCNDQNREQIHLQRRQALRNRQRDAAISGKSVRSVIETEVENEPTNCPHLTCVRMTPRLKNSETADVYQRLSKGDENVKRIDKEKPPPAIDLATATESTFSNDVSGEVS